MSIQVVFETHSTSVDNEHGIATGWLEGELSVTGREQAALLGERRRDDGIDLVVSSGPAARGRDGGDRLRGVTDPGPARLAAAGVQLRRVERHAARRLEAERVRRIDVPFPGGESWRDAVERHAGFLRELAARRDVARVLLIGHVATRWALDHLLTACRSSNSRPSRSPGRRAGSTCS